MKKISLFIIILLLTTAIATDVSAQVGALRNPQTQDFVPLVKLPPDFFPSQTDLPQYLSGMFRLLIAVAGLLAVIRIVWAGFVYVTAEKLDSKAGARKMIESALWGLILAMTSYLILNTINPRLLEFRRIEVRPTNPPNSQTGSQNFDPNAPQIQMPISGSKTNNVTNNAPIILQPGEQIVTRNTPGAVEIRTPSTEYPDGVWILPGGSNSTSQTRPPSPYNMRQ